MRHKHVMVLVDPLSDSITLESATGAAVWVVDTPANRVVVERLWKAGGLARDSITLYRSPNPGDAEVNLAAAIALIEMHHGHYAARPSYRELRICGLQPSDKARQLLNQYGLSTIQRTADGFIALKT
jgi:hypothetical protein